MIYIWMSPPKPQRCFVGASLCSKMGLLKGDWLDYGAPLSLAKWAVRRWGLVRRDGSMGAWPGKVCLLSWFLPSLSASWTQWLEQLSSHQPLPQIMQWLHECIRAVLLPALLVSCCKQTDTNLFCLIPCLVDKFYQQKKEHNPEILFMYQ